MIDQTAVVKKSGVMVASVSLTEAAPTAESLLCHLSESTHGFPILDLVHAELEAGYALRSAMGGWVLSVQTESVCIRHDLGVPGMVLVSLDDFFNASLVALGSVLELAESSVSRISSTEVIYWNNLGKHDRELPQRLGTVQLSNCGDNSTPETSPWRLQSQTLTERNMERRQVAVSTLREVQRGMFQIDVRRGQERLQLALDGLKTVTEFIAPPTDRAEAYSKELLASFLSQSMEWHEALTASFGQLAFPGSRIIQPTSGSR